MSDAPSQQKRGHKPVAQQGPSRVTKHAGVRKRTVLACEECRVRKRRCDGAVPACGGCTKRRSQCIYSSEVEAKEWNQSMIQSLRQRLEELERGAEAPSQTTAPQPSTSTGSSEIDNKASHDDARSQTTERLESVRDRRTSAPVPSESIPGLQQPFSTLPTPVDIELFDDEPESAPPNARSPTRAETPSPKQDWYSSRCIGQSNFERLMKPIVLAMNRRTDVSKSVVSGPSDFGASPSPEVASPSSAPVTCSCHRLIDAGCWHLPLRRQADSLVAIYFARHARMFPVLHRPTFLKQYQAIWESRSDPHRSSPTCVGICKHKSRGKLFPATVNCVFALAALFSSRNPECNASRAAEFYRLAESIDVLELLNEEVGLELVQLNLLMAFYLQSTERFSKCWNMAGLALRTAQNMGLHFNVSEAHKRGLLPSFPTQVECEMRRRVWYACILLESEVAMTFAQPLMIPAVGKAVKLPEAIDDCRLSDEVGKWNVQPKELPSLLEYYVHALKLYDILGQVLERQELRPQAHADTVSNVRAILSLDCKIMEWRDALPPYLRYGSSFSDCDPLKGVGVLDAVPDSEVVLDFPALTSRLHCRFLCVRQLILRPALDLLFEKQQNEKSLVVTEHTVRGKLKDTILSNIAVQCILTAIELVEFLASRIQTQTFVCWWYNTHYLHTSGSTILLGRLCTFDDGSLPSESLTSSWDLCLHHLGRYDNMSSVARKSSHLLRESAKRLLEYEGDVSAMDERQGHTLRSHAPEKAAHGLIPDPNQYTAGNGAIHNIIGSGDSLQTSRGFQDFSFETTEPDAQLSLLEGGDTWDNGTFGYSSWMFMPPISQLETFPLQFEGSNFV
ncbi:hypothetical protein H2204_007511 [Knufia peltigerae]|uniref:Zn(2)-C6 fungal-type domain-containing protein n=1 Tax=Knufia peltigerae TaxID=1002370 RepID=A0AA38Y1N3_9EURO|nr:hypothetical protein H2204_007511 [Knufia peltigerae]